MKAARGRADLLRARLENGKSGLEDMAEILGYHRKTSIPKKAKQVSMEGAKAPSSTVSAERTSAPKKEVADEGWKPIPFWYAATWEQIEESKPQVRREKDPALEGAQALRASDLLKMPGRQPETPPLVRDSRLFPVLRHRLSSEIPSRELDLDRFVDLLGRGVIPKQLPYRPLSAWASRIVVLIDRSRYLLPFWDDQDRLVRQLRRRLGNSAIRAVRFHGENRLPWRVGRHRFAFPPVEPGDAVLLLGDLGFYSGHHEDLWHRTMLRLHRLGTAPTALVPCPPSRWDRPTARRWRALEWEYPIGASRRGRAPSREELQQRVDALLVALSFTSRVELGLLRAVRQALPAISADAGTEFDAWNTIAGEFDLVGALNPARYQRLQPLFAQLGDELKKRITESIRKWRVGLPSEIWLDEVIGLAAAGDLPAGTLSPEEIQKSRLLWAQLAVTAAPESTDTFSDDVKDFILRSLQHRQPTSIWKDEILAPHLWRALEAASDGSPQLPAGIAPGVFGKPYAGSVREWRVEQVGTLQILPASSTFDRASPLASFEARRPAVGFWRGDQKFGSSYDLGEAAVRLPSSHEVELILQSDQNRVALRPAEKPDWATGIARDRCGLYATLEVAGIEQKMRYIPPGQFLMGSPDDEPGRVSDEGPQHQVTIEEGFWLAETPCTQALWEAVMGKKPSRFKTADRPVENVSWEDCQEFFAQLESLAPGFGGRLPTEAEWEYACRAGTKTATYAGPIEILGKNNAPILDEIAWYGGNCGQGFELDNGYDMTGSDWSEKQYDDQVGGSHPVKRKNRNPWGLYDMLGNVWEWCEDWFGSYSTESLVIPRGPEEGLFRVLRGGSWYVDARSVRAAYRYRGAPSFRLDSLGFRFARGQNLLKQGAEPLPGRGAPRRRIDGAARDERAE